MATVWPEAAGRLTRVLRTLGIPAEAVEDLVQEAGTRALESGIEFQTSQDLYRWAALVARREVIARWRKDGRVGGDVPEMEARTDVDAETQARLRVAAVGQVLPTMPERDRTLILGAIAAPVHPSQRVQLHRARARLAKMVGKLAAVLGLGRAANRFIRESRTTTIVLAAVIPILVIVGVTLEVTRTPSQRGTLENVDDTQPEASVSVSRGKATTGRDTIVAAPGAGPVTPAHHRIEVVSYLPYNPNPAVVRLYKSENDDDPIVCVQNVFTTGDTLVCPHYSDSPVPIPSPPLP